MPHLKGQGLRDGLQVLQGPGDPSIPDPSPVLEGHEDELRHRLEKVAQAPSESTDTDSEAPSFTMPDKSTKSSPATVLGVPHVSVSDASPLSPPSPENNRDPSPQPHSYTPLPLKFHTPSYSLDLVPSTSPEEKAVPPTPPEQHSHLSHLIRSTRDASHHKGLSRLLEHDRYSPDRSSGQDTPTPQEHHHPHNVIRPLVKAIMAFEKGRKFSASTSVHRKRKMSTLVEKEGAFGPALNVCKLLSPSIHLLLFSLKGSLTVENPRRCIWVSRLSSPMTTQLLWLWPYTTPCTSSTSRSSTSSWMMP